MHDCVGEAFEYVGCDRDQLFPLPPAMADRIPEGHLAWNEPDVPGQDESFLFDLPPHRPDQPDGQRDDHPQHGGDEDLRRMTRPLTIE